MASVADDEHSLTDLLARVAKAQEQQGERISRVLHDEAGPLLSAIGLQVDLLRMELGEKCAELSPHLLELQRLLEEAVAQVRDLSYELNPAMVERAGLECALKRLAARYGRSYSGALRLGFEGAVRLPAAAAVAMYRIAELALDNAVRHAGCSRIETLVRVVEGAATLEVIDNGRGFSVEEAREQRRGLGLELMRHHASQAGLRWSIASTPEKGTIVKAVYQPPGSLGR